MPNKLTEMPLNSKTRELVLPGNNPEENDRIASQQSIMFIGANGSGKTRLGTWIELEGKQDSRVHRISAQKSLSMPDSTTPMSIDIAERNLLFGSPEREDLVSHYRWNQKPATSLLNDYEKLMVYLFSDETEENARFKAECVKSAARVEPPRTKIDQVKDVWEKVLPHRELIIGGLRIETRVRGDQDAVYNSSEMSDGERVIFYLIGQCLAAPKDGIIIIDEPELHLHKSLQSRLWLEIEKLRTDCLFVYFTHDVDFAAAHESAIKIWLKSYDGKKWDWELVKSDEGLPDDLLYELLGSRKSVIFVEGDIGSLDTALYRTLFPEHLVIPRGSCQQVIQTVKALKVNHQLQYLNVCGLIDRDRRSQAEIDALKEHSIFVMKVAEVENLFCTREILEIVSERLARDPKADYQAVSRAIFDRLRGEIDKQVSMHAAAEISYKLNCFNAKAVGKEKLAEALKDLTESIDVAMIYQDSSARFQRVVDTEDYDELLMLYNRKSLLGQASRALGLAHNELAEFAVRLAQSDASESIRCALRPYMGTYHFA